MMLMKMGTLKERNHVLPYLLSPQYKKKKPLKKIGELHRGIYFLFIESLKEEIIWIK